MKKIALTILVLSIALLMVVCGQATPDPEAIGTALAQTLAAQPPTIPDLPWDNIEPTPIPTNIPLPTNITEFTTLTINMLESLEDIESVSMVRVIDGTIEIEVKTSWSSENNQPPASHNIVSSLATIYVTSLERDGMEELTASDNPILHLVTYSYDGDYRYMSDTDYDTLEKVLLKQISYEEWVTASNAGFR